MLHSGKWMEKFQPLAALNVVLPMHLRRSNLNVEVFHCRDESLGEDKLQTCAKDESCQSGCLHEIANSSVPSNVWKYDRNMPIGKDYTCFVVCLELWRTINESSELWGVKYQLMKEGYHQIVE